MKKLNLITLSIILVCLSTRIKSQVSAYSFSQSLKPYGLVNNGNLIGTVLQDDDANVLSLPFPFLFAGSTFTQIYVASNGHIGFGNMGSFSSTNYYPISDPTTQNIISPFANDLFMGTAIQADLVANSNTLTNASSTLNLQVGDSIFDFSGDFIGNSFPKIVSIQGNNIVLDVAASSTGSIYDVVFSKGSLKENVIGNSPNRIFEIEFRNFCRYTVYDEMFSFKVRLFETSNNIEFLYGPNTPGQNISQTLEVGLKGNSNTDFNIRKVDASITWSNSVAGLNLSDACIFSTSNSIIVGQSYLWSPTTCAVPQLSITQSNSVSCAGKTVSLTANGASSYTWVGYGTNNVLIITPTITSNYTLVGANGNCSTTNVISQQVLPNPSISIASSANTICAGKSATITATGAATYSWSNGSTNNRIIVSPSTTTTYTLTGNNQGCSSIKTIIQNVSNCTGIESSDKIATDLIAFPNPFSTFFNLENTSEEPLEINIYDQLGKLVQNLKIEAKNKMTIETENWNRGLYFIHLQLSDKKFVKKIIKI